LPLFFGQKAKKSRGLGECSRKKWKQRRAGSAGDGRRRDGSVQRYPALGGLLQIRCICSKRRFRPLAEESSAAVVETRARRLYLPCKYRRDRSGLSCSHPASAAP
jgi:hypothetical protein